MELPSAYLDVEIDRHVIEKNKHLEFVKNRNLLIKLDTYITRSAQKRLTKLQSSDCIIEIRKFMIGEILYGIDKTYMTMSYVVKCLIPVAYLSGTRDDLYIVSPALESLHQRLFYNTIKCHIQAMKLNIPIRLRKLAFDKCVDTIVSTGRVFEQDARISGVFNDEFVESVNIKNYLLTRMRDRRDMFDHRNPERNVYAYMLHENDESVVRVLNYLS